MWNGLNNFKIQVRAWIPEENMMIYSGSRLIGTNYSFIFNNYGNLVVLNNCTRTIVHSATVMPCIQLDCGCHEIYVGDFVDFQSEFGDEYQRGIVEYNTDDYTPQFCICYDYGNITDFSHRKIKVIGNVFENEELFDEGLI